MLCVARLEQVMAQVGPGAAFSATALIVAVSTLALLIISLTIADKAACVSLNACRSYVEVTPRLCGLGIVWRFMWALGKWRRA